MPINTATAKFEDIKAAETSELLELYNKITEEGIKKFRDRSTAERRTWKVIQQLGPNEDIERTIENEKEKSKENKVDGKRASFENRVIQLLVKENPKRPESRAHKKFGILMDCDGKTIKDFKSKEGKFPTLDTEKGWPATELRWALRLELVKIINTAV